MNLTSKIKISEQDIDNFLTSAEHDCTSAQGKFVLKTNQSHKIKKNISSRDRGNQEIVSKMNIVSR